MVVASSANYAIGVDIPGEGCIGIEEKVDRIYWINGVLREKSCNSFPAGLPSILLMLSFSFSRYSVCPKEASCLDHINRTANGCPAEKLARHVPRSTTKNSLVVGPAIPTEIAALGIKGSRPNRCHPLILETITSARSCLRFSAL